MLGFCLCCRDYRHNALVLAALVEVYNSINECIKSVILTDTYILARVVASTALANDNVACNTCLTTPNLNA